MRKALPVLTRHSQKLPTGIAVALVCAVLYAVPSALTKQRAVEIGMTAWEQAIPYVPQTVWPYLAQYPLLLLAFFGTRDLLRCTRFLYAVLIVQALAALVFLAVPLRYAREAHVAPAGTDAWTLAAAEWVRRIDAPVNCLPSLHVTSVLLCIWLTGFERPWRALLVAAVGLASIASTLTFKQHYAVDLLAGLLLAVLGWRLAAAATASRPPPAALPAHGRGASLHPESPHDPREEAARG
jgi:membrane-associated phospholipid phosphatase